MADGVLPPDSELLSEVAARARDSVGRPYLLGIAGPPAAGKSTLAQRLADDLSQGHGLVARHCPMDGFHLPNERLDALGLREAKGRIDTFDAPGLLAAMQRLSAKTAFWWPVYSRSRHDPVADGLRINGNEDVCIVEGNYLFCDAPVWRDIGDCFHFRMFVDAPDEVLRRRLLERHRSSGRNLDEAVAKIARIDLPNARKIRAGRHIAEVVIDDTGSH